MKSVVMEFCILDNKKKNASNGVHFSDEVYSPTKCKYLENQYIMKGITAWLNVKIAWNTVLLSVIRLYYHYVWLLLI